MKVLFIGGSKQSWQMRGRQMAAAMPNARATTKPDTYDWIWADVVVLVKNAVETYWRHAASCGKPVVWDVVDFWKQPRDNDRPIADHVAAVQQRAKECNARLLIGATEAMAKDIGGVYLPHHCRIGLQPTPPRPEAKVVAYDGSPRYLGSWLPAIEDACRRLKLRFVINPPDLSAADVLVAFRGEEWDGEVCRRWKSGVKLVNANCAGRPILRQFGAASDELFPYGVAFDDVNRLADEIDFACDAKFREEAYEDGLKCWPSFTDKAIASRYTDILRTAVRKAS